jgi:hypothetical protein
LANSSDNDVLDSDVIKKKEKEMSKGLQDTYKEDDDMQVQNYELSKGAESEREKSTKRPSTGA